MAALTERIYNRFAEFFSVLQAIYNAGNWCRMGLAVQFRKHLLRNREIRVKTNWI